MKVVATVPPFVALQLLDELEAAGIPAQSTDMAPGVGIAAYPGLLETTATVWVLDEGDLVAALKIFEEMRGEAAEAMASEDEIGLEDDPVRPDEALISARRRNAYLLVLLLWTGPVGLIMILLVFLLIFGGVG